MEPASHPTLRDGLASWLLAAGLLAGARASLFALQDGYLARGAFELGASSTARHFFVGFALVLAAGWPIRFAWVRFARPVGVVAALAGVALGTLFASGRLPSFPFHTPGFESTRAQVAQVACALVAIAAVTVLLSSPRRFGRLRAAGAVACVVAAVAAVPLFTGLFRAQRADGPPRPNVILISLDTLRTDRLSCYGYERPTTPEIDAFAAQGMRFTRAYAPHPWTLTSHMTMLTGRMPSDHGVDEDRRLSSSIPTLAELLELEGYTSLALVDPVVWLNERFGFDRGFAAYRRAYGDADVRIEMLRPMLDDLGDGPFFLFLHFFDPHSDDDAQPYEAADEDHELFCGWFQGSFTGCIGERCASKLLKAANDEEVELSAEERRYIHDTYDAGVRTMDRALGALFRELEARGLYESSIVILTSDHGEELGDHGKFLHGTHYEECVSVPLVVRMPDGGSGTVSDALVSHVDLAATVLELCGANRSLVDGHSHAELLRGEAYGPRSSLFFDAGGGNLGIRRGSHKLISGRLFDLDADPAEHTNLLADDEVPELAVELRTALDEERARLAGAARARADEDVSIGLTDSDRDAVRDLGYGGGD